MAIDPQINGDQPKQHPLECWALLECPQGKILRESLEAVTVGLMFQNQFHVPVTVLWTGLPPVENQLEYLSKLGVKRILYLAADSQQSSSEESLLRGLKALYLEKKTTTSSFWPDLLFFPSGSQIGSPAQCGLHWQHNLSA